VVYESRSTRDVSSRECAVAVASNRQGEPSTLQHASSGEVGAFAVADRRRHRCNRDAGTSPAECGARSAPPDAASARKPRSHGGTGRDRLLDEVEGNALSRSTIGGDEIEVRT